MSSRRISSAGRAAREFWRPLARQAGWDVSLAAQHHGVSVRQLERLCQRDLGCTPREWFQRERMVLAAELLAARQSIKIVAGQLGYSQPANFSRDFKRHFGRPPRAFAPRPLFLLPPDSPVRA